MNNLLGTATMGYDCIVIPGAVKATAASAVVTATKQCGRSKGLITADGGNAATVCSKFTYDTRSAARYNTTRI